MEEKHVLTARERKALKTKNKLLEAGKKVLLEQGFQKATVTQIIREAGTGYGTAYVYFKNKDELLIVLMEDVMAKFYGVAGRTFAPKTSKEAYHLIEDQVKVFFHSLWRRGIFSASLKKHRAFRKPSPPTGRTCAAGLSEVSPQIYGTYRKKDSPRNTSIPNLRQEPGTMPTKCFSGTV
jgi:AcrR family transcriptional regulator